MENFPTRIPLLPISQVFSDVVGYGGISGLLPDSSPVIVSLGVGVDSVAMLAGLYHRDIRPDAIVTSLVGRERFGNERSSFYAYLPILEAWLERVGFPKITYVWYEMKRKAKHFKYNSLAGNVFSNQTLPSISFRRNKSCSLKHKGKLIDRWVTDNYADSPCYRLIGYDCTEGNRGSRFSTTTSVKARQLDRFVYPLQQWWWNRDVCTAEIEGVGLPIPNKSSCFFCASMKESEIDTLRVDELWVIVLIEANASPKLRKLEGLWGPGKKSMTSYIVERELLPSTLVDEVWEKWSADVRPSELSSNPNAVADDVLFGEARRLAALSGFVHLDTPLTLRSKNGAIKI